MDLVSDTNVWYDIAAGRRTPATLKAEGRRLLATPVSFIEIASKLSDRSFEQRSGAARAVVEFTDDILIDTDRHLAAVWGLGVEPLGFDWIEAFKALADAPDLETLQRGVIDHAAGVSRKVRPDVAALLRARVDLFVPAVVDVVDGLLVPGYRANLERQRPRYADTATSELIDTVLRTPEIERLTVVGTRARAALNLDVPPPPPSEDEIDRGAEALSPYVRAYARYVHNCATKYTPKPNDWGDLECFAYLQGERRLLTRDKRWLEIADEAGLSQWVLDPEGSS